MKKTELERLLMDPEASKKLIDRGISIKQRHGESVGDASGRLSASEPLPHEVRPNIDEIKANDFDNCEIRPLLAGIGRFVPEMAKEGPKRALAVVLDKCRKEPSEKNQLLLEDAINRLTCAGEPDAESEKLISEAIERLASPDRPKGAGEQVTDSIWSRLYRHSDYNGRSFFVNHGPGWVYRLVRSSALKSASMHDNISSLYVDASASEVAGWVIIFQHDRYHGRYARYTTTAGDPTVRNWVSYVGNYMNDRTSSILVVRRFNNEVGPIPLDQFGGIGDEIEDLVDSMSGISLRGGGPVVTWDMWPEGPTSGSDPHPNDHRRFIYIRVPVRIDVPNWFDYDAEVRYWIYPYVDGGGTLRAYVAYYGAWVEGGVKHSQILNGVMSAIPGTLGTINARLNTVLGTVNSFFGPFVRQYFLPGTANATGHTNDDVSIVLVRS